MSQVEFKNGLLKALPPQTLSEVRSCMDRISLRKGQALEESRLPLQHVYFLESGIVSIQARTRADGLVGAGIVGAAGLVGIPVILESMRTPLRAIAQSAGQAIRISAADIHRLMATDPSFRHVLLGYVQAMLVQSAYIGLCNARHTVDQRIRRWLLLADFALAGQDVCVTHQIIATLLGVRRPSVTSGMGELEKKGLIALARGCVTIRDREGLADGACECHRIISMEFMRVLQRQQSSRPPLALTPQPVSNAQIWLE